MSEIVTGMQKNDGQGSRPSVAWLNRHQRRDDKVKRDLKENKREHTVVRSCKSGQAFRVGPGFGTGSGRVWA